AQTSSFGNASPRTLDSPGPRPYSAREPSRPPDRREPALQPSNARATIFSDYTDLRANCQRQFVRALLTWSGRFADSIGRRRPGGGKAAVNYDDQGPLTEEVP